MSMGFYLRNKNTGLIYGPHHEGGFEAVDDKICENYGVDPHPNNFYGDWVRRVGYLIAANLGPVEIDTLVQMQSEQIIKTGIEKGEEQEATNKAHDLIEAYKYLKEFYDFGNDWGDETKHSNFYA